MIAGPLTRSKTDHYTGALAASRDESVLQLVFLRKIPDSGQGFRHHDTF